MSIPLPASIQTYLRSKKDHDTTAIEEIFTPQAKVNDNGEEQEFHGREAIARWMAESTSKYKTSLEVIQTSADHGDYVVNALVSGDFPRSPAEFVYRFTLKEKLIDRLVIEFIGFR